MRNRQEILVLILENAKVQNYFNPNGVGGQIQLALFQKLFFHEKGGNGGQEA